MRICILVVFIFTYLSSCSDNSSVPPGIIKPAQMQQIVWDVMRAGSLAEEIARRDSSKTQPAEHTRLTNEVFAIHHITRPEFESSFVFYSRHPAIMKII